MGSSRTGYHLIGVLDSKFANGSTCYVRRVGFRNISGVFFIHFNGILAKKYIDVCALHSESERDPMFLDSKTTRKDYHCS